MEKKGGVCIIFLSCGGSTGALKIMECLGTCTTQWKLWSIEGHGKCVIRTVVIRLDYPDPVGLQ